MDMAFYPHLVIDADFLQKYPIFSDFSYPSYKTGKPILCEPFKLPLMAPSDTPALDNTIANLSSELDDYGCIGDSASVTFRGKSLQRCLDAAVRHILSLVYVSTELTRIVVL